VQVFKTQYGVLKLEGKFPTKVTFNNKVVNGLFNDAMAYVSDPQIFQINNTEVLLFSSSAGRGCAGEYNFFTTYPNGTFKVGIKNGFGTCGGDMKASQNGDEILVSVSGFGGDPAGYNMLSKADKKQVDREAKVKHYWKYKDGKVVKVSK